VPAVDVMHRKLFVAAILFDSAGFITITRLKAIFSLCYESE
jgi:hypothetical protein